MRPKSYDFHLSTISLIVEAVENSRFDFGSLPTKHIFSKGTTQGRQIRRSANRIMAQAFRKFERMHFSTPSLGRTNMTTLGPWRNEDFESMSWHDVHVHGLRFACFNEEYGAADVVLDIDYILRWEESGDSLQFTLCPAELVFHDVFGLKLELDYATPSAGMCPFSIDSIQREVKSLPSGGKTFRWTLDLNWPYGSIEFDAPAFSQRLTGIPKVRAGTQFLSPNERSAA